jgi:hypothetical protein
MEENYPIIILPKRLLKIQTSSPTLPTEPQEPNKPLLKEPTKPYKPEEPTKFTQAWGCGLISIAVFILIIYISSKTEIIGDLVEGLPLLGLIIFAAPILGLIYIVGYHSNHKKDTEVYTSKIKKYEKELIQFEYDKANYKTNYENSLIHFENEIYPNYLKNKEAYYKEKARILSQENVLAHRTNLVKNYFANTKRPDRIYNNYLTGVSEGPFFDYLQSKSKNFIKGFGVIDNRIIGKYYLPDIVYFDEQSGILIDIEIDEPYLGSDGSPIHYIGYDDKRNQFFTDYGWIVVRFAEIQVVKYPEKCYNFLYNLIKGLQSGKVEYDNKILEQVPKWTKEVAHKMAFRRYRNTYLGRNLVESIPNENLFEKNQIVDSNELPDDLPF